MALKLVEKWSRPIYNIQQNFGAGDVRGPTHKHPPAAPTLPACPELLFEAGLAEQSAFRVRTLALALTPLPHCPSAARSRTPTSLRLRTRTRSAGAKSARRTRLPQRSSTTQAPGPAAQTSASARSRRTWRTWTTRSPRHRGCGWGPDTPVRLLARVLFCEGRTSRLVRAP